MRPNVVETRPAYWASKSTAGLKADALIGGEVILRRDGVHAAAIAAETPKRRPLVLIAVMARQFAWMPPFPDTRGVALRSGVSTG